MEQLFVAVSLYYYYHRCFCLSDLHLLANFWCEKSQIYPRCKLAAPSSPSQSLSSLSPNSAADVGVASASPDLGVDTRDCRFVSRRELGSSLLGRSNNMLMSTSVSFRGLSEGRKRIRSELHKQLSKKIFLFRTTNAIRNVLVQSQIFQKFPVSRLIFWPC